MMTDDYSYKRLIELNEKLMDSAMKEHQLETRLKSMEMRVYILDSELHQSRLEQLELLKIINEQINK